MLWIVKIYGYFVVKHMIPRVKQNWEQWANAMMDNTLLTSGFHFSFPIICHFRIHKLRKALKETVMSRWEYAGYSLFIITITINIAEWKHVCYHLFSFFISSFWILFDICKVLYAYKNGLYLMKRKTTPFFLIIMMGVANSHWIRKKLAIP